MRAAFIGALLLTAAAAPSADTALSRAEHGVLLGIARVGTRLVAVGDRGSVLLSDDGGAHWSLGTNETKRLLTSVLFTDGEHGIAVGQDETVLTTADAGAHWTKRFDKPSSDNALFSVAALTPARLIASGAYNLLLSSEDGGTHWVASSLPNLDEDYHLNCVATRGGDVLITGESGHAFLRHGTAWMSTPVPYNGSQFGCLAGRDGAFYSFGLRGSLFVMPAGASTWKRIDTGTQASFFAGVERASGQVVLVGANGLLLVLDPTTGATTRIDTGTTASLSGVAEAGANLLAIVGDKGVFTLPAPVAAR